MCHQWVPERDGLLRCRISFINKLVHYKVRYHGSDKEEAMEKAWMAINQDAWEKNVDVDLNAVMGDNLIVTTGVIFKTRA